MDGLQACQFLQNFVGRSSSSVLELFELVSALVPISDEIADPAPEKILATASSEGATGSINSLQYSQSKLPRTHWHRFLIFSFIAIHVKVTVFHRYWLKNLIQMRLGEKAAVILSGGGSSDDMRPMNVKMSFRFAEKFDIDCYEVSITNGEERSIMGLPSVMAHLPVKPLFALDWAIGKYDPTKSAGTGPLGLIERQIPRVLKWMKIGLKRSIQVRTSVNRTTLRYSTRILKHVEQKISALERSSGAQSESQKAKVKQLRSKLDIFCGSPAYKVRAAIDGIVGMVNPTEAVNLAKTFGSVVHPDQVINLSKNLGNLGKLGSVFQGEEPLAQVAGDKSSPQVEVPRNPIASSNLSKPNPAIEPQTRFAMNFKLPKILQVLLLALITEIYFTSHSIFDRFFAVVLAQIQPNHSRSTSFSLSGSSLPLDMKRLPSFNGTMGLSSPISLPGVDSLGSILKPTLPFNTTLSAGTSKFDPRTSVGRLPPLMASKDVLPLDLRSVSWITSSSAPENDAKDVDTKSPVAEIPNRTCLPKSPKPNAQLYALSMNHTAVSKPIIEPMQMMSASFKDHSIPTSAGEKKQS
ncbi:hypothetical protein PSHT_05162 [Puccinia striiformis]|uniref:Uncharacterized protein n=1 Tax=Puccinia striiformis TaxID=27350 RepID=A0A2S4WB78_9BASI|nr:hypothetical protein PSHT_05162 [Puccinia striiformis]